MAMSLRNCKLGVLIIVIALVSATLSAGDDQHRAGISIEPIWTYDSDLMVGHVGAADLNGDFVADIVACEYNSEYYGRPSFIYALDGVTGDTIWTYLVQDGVRAVAFGDITNDGVPDVIAGTSYDGGDTPDGRVHAIDGTDGSSIWIYAPYATTTDVVIADLNNDDYMDVVVSSFDDHIHAINGQTGARLWWAEFGSLWVNGVDAADINGDGIDDIAYAHEYLTGYDNHCGVLDGTDGSIIWDTVVTYSVLDALVDDFDNDGVLEVAFAGEDGSDNGLLIVRTASNGVLEWEHNFGYFGVFSTQFTLYSQDLDDNGDVELIVANRYGSFYVYVFEGNSSSPMFTSDELAGYPRKLAFGDVTGDKDMDIVAATGDRISVLSGLDGSLEFDYIVNGTFNAVAVADIEGEDYLNIVAGGGANNSGTPPDPGIGVWAMRTVVSPVIWEHNFGEYGNAIEMADLNGDGFMDVVSVCSVDDQATAISGETGGQLWQWTGTQNLYCLTTGDFDNNGQMDVAVSGNDDKVSAINGFDGSTMWQFPLGDQAYRQCIKATDLNGDGSDDVIAGSDDSRVYAINGVTGGQIWSAPAGGAVNQVRLAQMNATGPLDVIVAVGGGDATGQKVLILDGSSGSELWNYPCPAEVEYIEVVDVTDDEMPDIAAGLTPYNQQVIMIDGFTHSELWTAPVAVESNTNGMGFGDCDGDKTPDIVVPVGGTPEKVMALSGDHGGEIFHFDTGDEVNCVMVYDVDNDGRNEVIAGADDNNVYVIDGALGTLEWNYSTAGDIMQVQVGDISGNGLPNIAAVTFGSSGIVYAFRSLATGQAYLCGDANNDGVFNISDYTYLIDYFVKGGSPPPVPDAADVNGCPGLTIADVIYMNNHFANGGPAPCEGSVDCDYTSGTDAITIDCPAPAAPGSTFGVTIRMINNEVLGGLYAAFTYDSDLIDVISIDTAGSIPQTYGMTFMGYVDSSSNFFSLSMLSATSTIPAQVSGVLATVNFKVADGVTSGSVDIDTTSAGIGGEFCLVPVDGGIIHPAYIDCIDNDVVIMEYLCGDATDDEVVNVGDAVCIINYIFKGGQPPSPLDAGDANCDGDINVGDAVYIINYIFKGGLEPCCP